MLGRRLRRRPNIEPTLFQCLVFAGMLGSPVWLVKLSYYCAFSLPQGKYNQPGFHKFGGWTRAVLGVAYSYSAFEVLFFRVGF